MAYTVPQFNLLAKIWDCKFPSAGAADWSSVPVQKYVLSRMSLDATPPSAPDWWKQYTPPVTLRFPIGHAAFSGPPSSWDHVCFEVPSGSGQYYRAYWQEIQHQGFPNQYAIILVTPCDVDGKAIPPAGSGMLVGTRNDVCPLVPPPPPPPPPPPGPAKASFTGICFRVLDYENWWAVACEVQVPDKVILSLQRNNNNFLSTWGVMGVIQTVSLLSGHELTLDYVMTSPTDISMTLTGGLVNLNLTRAGVINQSRDRYGVLSAPYYVFPTPNGASIDDFSVSGIATPPVPPAWAIFDMFTGPDGSYLSTHNLGSGGTWNYPQSAPTWYLQGGAVRCAGDPFDAFTIAYTDGEAGQSVGNLKFRIP